MWLCDTRPSFWQWYEAVVGHNDSAGRGLWKRCAEGPDLDERHASNKPLSILLVDVMFQRMKRNCFMGIMLDNSR